MLDLTPFLRVYSRRRSKQLERQAAAQAQEHCLLQLVSSAKNTRFGRNHDFALIRSVQDYQRRCPLRYYENFWEDYWKNSFPILKDCSWPGTIKYFALSSGTSSGSTKYIPCSKEILKSNSKGALDLLAFHLSNRPDSKVFGGKCFFLGGSTDLREEAPGVLSGDLSGITVKEMPFWAKPRYFPPLHLALLKNWEDKISAFANAAIKEDLRMISGVPSWLLILFNRIFELTGKSKLVEVFPNLELLVHGGVSFEPYKQHFDHLLEGSHAELREVYPASEGFIAVADRAYGEGLRVIADNGIFFEFVPLEELNQPDPARHWLGDIETGVNYALVMTTCAGLWSYVIGDTVRFTETNPPRLLVTGRTAYYLSAFGEHLIAEEIDDAVSFAAKQVGASVSDYSVGPVFPTHPGELGSHLFVIEFMHAVLAEKDRVIFQDQLKQRLCEKNEDYAGHLADGFGLKPPTVRVVEPGTFQSWMKKRGKLGGQNKVPRIITNTDLFADLLSWTAKKTG